MTIQFGKPNYSGTNTNTQDKTVYHKLGTKDVKDRTLIVRLAPPVGTLAERGIWSVYTKTHWGYGVPGVNNKTGKTYSRPVPFRCIERTDRNGNVIQPCPECDEIKAQHARLDAKVSEMAKAGRTAEEIEAATAYLRVWKKDHNLDKKWTALAKNLGGQWGLLQISHTTYKSLKGNEREPGLIDKLVAKGIDPLSPEKGVWFKFERTGTAFHEIKDHVEVLTEEVVVNGEALAKVKFDSLTQADLNALETMPSLDDLGKALTYDQIRMLVESGGDEATVRLVMNLPTATPTPPSATSMVSAPTTNNQALKMEFAPAATPSPSPADELAALKARLAELQGAMAPVSTPAAPQNPQPGANLKKDLSMDMNSFVEKFK